MTGHREITHQGIIQRKADSLPRYVEIPAALVAPWGLTGTTVVEGEMNGRPMGRRGLKRWDDERWFFDLPDRLCRAAGADVGDHVILRLWRTDESLPEELARLIRDDRRFKRAWDAMSESRRRMLREHVLDAKRSETRERRARKALLHGTE